MEGFLAFEEAEKYIDLFCYIYNHLAPAMIAEAFPQLGEHYCQDMWDRFMRSERDPFRWWSRLSRSNREQFYRHYVETHLAARD